MKYNLGIRSFVFLVLVLVFFTQCKKDDDILSFTVSFVVEVEGIAIEGASIAIEGFETLTTNTNGESSIELTEGTYPYSVACEGYDEKSGSITVRGVALSENIDLIETVYTISFNVHADGEAIEEALITIEGFEIPTSNANGESSIELPEGMYSYTVACDGYNEKNGSITVSGIALSENVELIATIFNISFLVEADGKAIENADISIEGYLLSNTDKSGKSSLSLSHGDYNYIVRRYGYAIFEGSILLEGGIKDKTENISLTANIYTIDFTILVSNAVLTLSGYINASTILDGEGNASFSFDYPLEENIQYVVSNLDGKIVKEDSINIRDKILSEHASGDRDWDGFEKLLEESDIPDKALALRVMKMYPDPTVFIRELKSLPSIYKDIQTFILPNVDQVSYKVEW